MTKVGKQISIEIDSFNLKIGTINHTLNKSLYLSFGCWWKPQNVESQSTLNKIKTDINRKFIIPFKLKHNINNNIFIIDFPNTFLELTSYQYVEFELTLFKPGLSIKDNLTIEAIYMLGIEILDYIQQKYSITSTKKYKQQKKN